MKKEQMKKDGPSCACGKEDLYEVWLKNQKDQKDASCAIHNKNKKLASTKNKVNQRN